MCCSEARVQFALLAWKNLILMKRKIFGTVLLFVSIVIFPTFLMLANFYLGVHSSSEPVVESSFEVKTDFNFLKNQISIHALAFAPNDDGRVENIVRRAVLLMNNDLIQVKGYENESDLENAMHNSSEIFGGIVFVNDSTNEITYKIRLREDHGRWFTNELMPNPDVGPRQKFESYFKRGFLTIQRAIDTSIITELGGNVSSMKTFLKKLAYPGYLANTFYPILYHTFSFVTLVGFFNLASLICREIVEEKEKKVKEYMKLLGLRNWIYWLSWFFKYLCLALLSSLLITIVYHVRPGEVAILNYTSPLITFIFVLLFSAVTIVFSFAVSTLFNKARTAVFAMVIIYFITVCLELYLKSNNLNNAGKTFQRVLYYLFPNLSFGLGCRIILNFEKSGSGIHWNNLDQGCDDERGFSLLEVFFMFLVDLLLYGIITWYVDAVHPGEFGSPQPFYFPFQKRYWFGFSDDTGFDDLCDSSSNYNLRSEYFEANSPNCKIGIKLRNLTKVFNKDSKPAVDNLNLDICKDSITALLGHNGAGKTTTMFMLTGFVVPSKGSAFISGLNIRHDMDKIRRNMGFCPQSNILFDNLTVKEHLELFARLKGRSNVKSDVSHMIAVLSLQAKKDTFSKKLSGGLKRKLSIAIALIGGSKFVILDEPTSGLDPEARREIWDVLRSHQLGRTMILTTHYMDEADYLGDKIAIMAEGVVQCYGSSMFLKKKYGIGYQLTIVQADSCDPSKIHELITSKISDAQLKNRAGAEMTYHLPKESSPEFPSLFLELETCGKTIGVDSFGVSVTSLEEVFIRVGEMCEENGDIIGEKTYVNETFNNSELCNFESTFTTDNDINNRVGGISLLMLRIYAMIHKRFLYTLRNKWITLVQLVVPVAFAIMACINFNAQHGQLKPRTSQPFSLDLERYDHPITIYATVDSSSDKLLQCYIKALDNIKGTYVYLNNQGFNYSSYDDMDEYFIKIGKQNLYHYRKSYQIATEIGSSYLLGFYNDESYHTMAIALTVLDNVWLQCLVSPQYTIKTINHPVTRLSNETGNDIYNHAKSLGMMFSLSTSYGLSVLIASFCVFLINERKSGAKTSQYISGATSFTFWTATFIWDFLNYLIPVLLVIVVIMAFRLEGYSSGMIPGYIFLGLMAYGWSSLPLVYLMSFLFAKGSTGFNWITTVNVLTGMGTIFIIVIADAVVKTTGVVEALEFVFYSFISIFCLVRNLQNVLYNYSIAKSCSYSSKYVSTEMCSDGSHNNQNDCCPDHPDNYFAWNQPGIGKSLIFMTAQGIIFFLILFIIESDILKNIRRMISLHKCYKYYSNGNVYEEDADVHNERLSVMNLKDKDLQSNLQNNALILKKLTKRYQNVVAVDDICLQIKTGECFGLLGVNGAGKTSTFKMMTGEESISTGCAYVKGISVAEELTKTRQYVGYCPQFDSLIDQLTAEEHLELHWRLRGVSSRVLKPYVKKSLQNFLINKYANKTIKQLSGGNKRKLCMAIALVGRPPLIFLDEPTTGIDPVSRRVLWNVLSTARQTGSTIILTSHSMEECEALCTRLVIMVNGQFKCLGSTQHLKSKFGSGYTVMLKTMQTTDQAANMANIDSAKDLILEHFPGSVLEFEGEGLINYRIEKSIPGATLANIFRVLEGSREILNLEDYSVGQATLEQIFVNFALSQQKSDYRVKGRSLVCNTSYDETDHV